MNSSRRWGSSYWYSFCRHVSRRCVPRVEYEYKDFGTIQWMIWPSNYGNKTKRTNKDSGVGHLSEHFSHWQSKLSSDTTFCWIDGVTVEVVSALELEAVEVWGCAVCCCCCWSWLDIVKLGKDPIDQPMKDGRLMNLSQTKLCMEMD